MKMLLKMKLKNIQEKTKKERNKIKNIQGNHKK